MSTKFLKYGIFLWFVAGSLPLGARNFYFSTSSGDDSRTFAQAQDPATPWKTIDHLNTIASQLQPGDSVLFNRQEVFPGGILIRRSGTQAAPIVFGAYGTGERPVIDGFLTASGWIDRGGGIYESAPLATGTEVNMVVIDDVNYAMGRFPNADADEKGYAYFESHTANSITDNQLISSTNWKGGELVLRTVTWAFEKVKITQHYGKRLYYSGSTDYDLEDGYGFFIQNHPKTLDQFGEWYYNPDTKRISIFFGDNAPDAHQVQVSAVDALANVAASYIVLQDLVLTGANQYGIVDNESQSQGLRVQRCRIKFTGIDGVYLMGHANFTMEYCEVLHSNNSGIRPLYNNPNTVLRHNYIRDTGMQPGMGATSDQNYCAIYKGTEGLIAEYNTIINTGYIGIRFADDDNLIKNNYIDTFCTVLDDGAGIYTFGGQGNPTHANRKVLGNIILNGIGAPAGTPEKSNYLAHGIYIDDNATDVEITGNTVANCVEGIIIHNARDFLIQNNTVFNNTTQLLLADDYFGNDIEGGEIKDNVLVARDRIQSVLYLYSKTKDFNQFGDFSANYYARPFYDTYPILLQYYQNGDNLVRRHYKLADWQKDYGQDAGTQKSPATFTAYTIDSQLGNNRFPNGAFNSNIQGVFCYSDNDCKLTRVTNTIMGSGALQVIGQVDARAIISIGAVDKTKQYLLRFSAAAQEKTSIDVYLRRDAPYGIISEKMFAGLDTEKATYELLFSFPETEKNSSIEFFSEKEDIRFWLDDIELYEVTASPTDPDEKIRFEYNRSLQDTTIVLDAGYIDVRRNTFSGTLTLAPFESVVLFKQPEVTPEVDPKEEEEEEPDNNGSDENDDPLPDPDPGTEDPGEAPVVGNDSLPTYPWESNIQRNQDDSGRSSELFDKQTSGRDEVEEIVSLPSNFENWKIYPNPISFSHSELTIEYYAAEQNITLVIIDQRGRTINVFRPENEIGWNRITWDPVRLPSGVYRVFSPQMLLRSWRTYPFVVMD